jgi:DNA-binding NtrC family response regulator
LSSGKKVLLIEDEPQDREHYMSLLRQRGFEVRACESPAQAAALLEKEKYDFVLVEQGTPAFEGRMVLERVLELDRRLPTLVITRCADMGCYLEAMQMGATDYVEKTISDDEMLHIIETHLRPPHLAA